MRFVENKGEAVGYAVTQTIVCWMFDRAEGNAFGFSPHTNAPYMDTSATQIG